MAPVALERFAKDLAGANRIGIDTAPLIYHLEDTAPYVHLTTHLLARASTGTVQLMLSTITIGELLVGPWKIGGRKETRRIEAVLLALPGTTVTDVTWEVARRAAEVRARTDLPFPDSLILASAIAYGADRVVTNDAAWRIKALPYRVLVLDDYV